jgi:hypothetical protein
MSDEDAKSALLDVRKAYRLIFLYQRRILDLVKVIKKQFEQHVFYQWSPCNCDPPPIRDSDPLKRWAWDFIPMYDFSILYLPSNAASNGKPQPGDWMLEIHFLTDDGFPHEQEPEPNPSDPTEFRPVQSSASTVVLAAYLCTKAVKGNWFWDVWNEMDWQKEETKDYPDFGIKLVYKRFPLADMLDEKAVRSAVEQFKEFCHHNFGSKIRNLD